MKMSKAVVTAAVALALSAGAASAQNTLAVNAGAALEGAFGLAVNVAAAATNAVYVQSDHPTSETHMRIVWRMRLQNLVAPLSGAGRNFRFMMQIDNDFAALPHKVYFAQRQNTTGNWRLAVWSMNTGTNTYDFAGGAFLHNYAANVNIQFDCETTMATSGANGILVCDRNGVEVINVTNLNDGGRQTDSVAFGFFDFDGFPGTAGAGVAHLDAYESYR